MPRQGCSSLLTNTAVSPPCTCALLSPWPLPPTGLCYVAKRMGRSCWLATKIVTYHQSAHDR
jgi:hypothetical protein